MRKAFNRIKRHIRAASLIGRAIRKHEIKNFKLELLWEAINKREANIVEIAAISAHKSIHPNGYNLTAGGEGILNCTNAKGHKVSKAVRKIISKANIGNTNASGKRSGQALKNIQEATIDRSELIKRNKENNPMNNPISKLKCKISKLKTSINKLERQGD